MAYLLKPNEHRLGMEDLPAHRATDMTVEPPRPTSLNYCSDRPNTMLYGTAPYMAGKGAPPNVDAIMLEDFLRPQSTSRFNRNYVDNRQYGLFPILDVSCSLPPRVHATDPISTTALIQNMYYSDTFCK